MNKVLCRLDSAHEKLIAVVTPLDEELFSHRSSDGEWSIAEVVHHLCLVENRVIKELDKELANPPRRLGPLRKLVPTSIVASRLIRVKAPKAMNPVNPPGKNECVSNYNAARARLKELYSLHGDKRLRQTIFNHPFLGEINGLATISFIGYHEVRHYKQICEVLKKLGNH
jgi:DinB family protein